MHLNKGTIITCEEGHEICELVESISSGDVIKSSSFNNFKNGNIQPQPLYKIGGPSSSCNKCGGKWMKPVNFGRMRLHTKKYGWV